MYQENRNFYKKIVKYTLLLTAKKTDPTFNCKESQCHTKIQIGLASKYDQRPNKS